MEIKRRLADNNWQPSQSAPTPLQAPLLPRFGVDTPILYKRKIYPPHRTCGPVSFDIRSSQN